MAELHSENTSTARNAAATEQAEERKYLIRVLAGGAIGIACVFGLSALQPYIAKDIIPENDPFTVSSTGVLRYARTFNCDTQVNFKADTIFERCATLAEPLRPRYLRISSLPNSEQAQLYSWQQKACAYADRREGYKNVCLTFKQS